MFRKIMLGGVTAAVIVGAGTAALATTGSDTTAGTPAASSSSSHHAKGGHQAGKKGKPGRMLLRKLAHGQIVVKTKQGFVTHDLIRGTVSSVSATSITVESLDKTSETFVVTKDTKVRARSNGKAAGSTIDKVSKGDHVFVGGTGASTFTAKHVIDIGTK